MIMYITCYIFWQLHSVDVTDTSIIIWIWDIDDLVISLPLLPQGGGGIVNQLRRSYSSGEFPDGDMNRNVKALPHIPDDDYDDHMHSSGTAAPRTRSRQRQRPQQQH